MRRYFILLAVLANVAFAEEEASPPSFSEISAATGEVASAYFSAYIKRDWDALEPLIGEGGGFKDPTASAVFGEVSVQGKAETIAYFRENYAGIVAMSFEQTRAFSSGPYAVFEGALNWTLKLGDGNVAETANMPFITILKVEDGQVIEHLDYADYHPFLDAYRKATAD